MKRLSIAYWRYLLIFVFLVSASTTAFAQIEQVDPEEFSSYDIDTGIGVDSLRVMYPGIPAAVLFAALPDTVVPLLRQHERLDMIDYAVAGRKQPIKNKLSGMSQLDTLSSAYIKVNLTDVSTLQGAVYGDGRGKMLNVVSYTIAPPYVAADSELFFYYADMKPVKADKVIKLPSVADFISSKGKDVNKDELVALVPFPTITYTLDPYAGTIVATLTVRDAMSNESFDMLKEHLKPQIVYRWTGKKFQQEKP